MSIKIPRCYDSHLHIVPTAEMKVLADLRTLKSAKEIQNFPIPIGACRGDWTIGFGWDASEWQDQPHRSMLDVKFVGCVLLSRIDGHSAWLNTKALADTGLWTESNGTPSNLVPFVETDSDGIPTGIIFDRALDFAFSKIPSWSKDQLMGLTESALLLLQKRGFTHLREMSSRIDLWDAMVTLSERKKLNAYVEFNFHCPAPSDLDALLKEYHQAQISTRYNLRPAGIKIFVDGAMGSEGAWLSSPYEGKNKNGFQLWKEDELEEVFLRCWTNAIPISVHAIGDRSVKTSLQTARKLRGLGVQGQLHLEHCQMINPSDYDLFEGLNVSCHMQPSHYLSDRRWMVEKLGSRADWCFPWCAIEQMGIPLFFGSDSPIEEASLATTRKAILQHRTDTRKNFEMDWTFPHSHPDQTFGPKCFTHVHPDGSLAEVVFDGRRVEN